MPDSGLNRLGLSILEPVSYSGARRYDFELTL